mgnify:CR=1 FL=1
MSVSEFYPDDPLPTLSQEEYAEALIERIHKEDFHVDAGRYQQRYDACKSRQEMSRLISDMKEFLDDIQ